MTMWARVEGDAVAELIHRDPVGHYHPDLVWVEVPVEWRELIAPGCRYVTGEFRPPLERDPVTGAVLATDNMAWLRARARAAIAAFARDARLQVAGTSDPLEVAGWPAKAALALRHVAAATDAADDAALLVEATLRGQTVADTVARIQAKAALYKPAVGQIDGWRAKADSAVDAALDAPSLVTELATLKAAAEADLAALLTSMQS